MERRKGGKKGIGDGKGGERKTKGRETQKVVYDRGVRSTPVSPKRHVVTTHKFRPLGQVDDGFYFFTIPHKHNHYLLFSARQFGQSPGALPPCPAMNVKSALGARSSG